MFFFCVRCRPYLQRTYYYLSMLYIRSDVNNIYVFFFILGRLQASSTFPAPRLSIQSSCSSNWGNQKQEHVS